MEATIQRHKRGGLYFEDIEVRAGKYPPDILQGAEVVGVDFGVREAGGIKGAVGRPGQGLPQPVELQLFQGRGA